MNYANEIKGISKSLNKIDGETIQGYYCWE